MAQVPAGFSFKAPRGQRQHGRRSRHPWEKWLDGTVQAITKEEWGTTTPQTMKVMMERQAIARKVGVQIEYDKETETLVFQSYELTPEEKAALPLLWYSKEAQAKRAAKAAATQQNGEVHVPETEPEGEEYTDEEREEYTERENQEETEEEPEPEPEPEPVKETSKQRKAREREEQQRADRNKKH